MITILDHDYCTYFVFDSSYKGLIIKLIGSKEIPCFKKSDFLHSIFLAFFLSFTQLIFIFAVSLLKLKNGNKILPK